jgi:hypothetical protein
MQAAQMVEAVAVVQIAAVAAALNHLQQHLATKIAAVAAAQIPVTVATVVVVAVLLLRLQHLEAEAAAVHLAAVQAVAVLLPNLVTQIHLKQVYLSQQQMPRQIRSSIVQEAQ